MNLDDWKTPAYRQNMVHRIDELIQQFQGPINRNAIDMENHVFVKASTKEEYVGYITKIMMFLRNGNRRPAGATDQATSSLRTTQNRPLLQGQSINTAQKLMNMRESLAKKMKQENSSEIVNPPADQYPKKEQAIVVDEVENSDVKDCILAVGNLIGPHNILFASEIPDRKVCLYLKTQELAETTVAANSTITFGSRPRPLRLLVPKSKPIIISRVFPEIPHSEIEKELLKLGVEPKSEITCMKAFESPELAHIMSFQRQVYVKPDDVSKLPKNLKIHYDDTNYWIYFSTEKVSCTICQEDGHLAEDCKSDEYTNIVSSTSENHD